MKKEREGKKRKGIGRGRNKSNAREGKKLKVMIGKGRNEKRQGKGKRSELSALLKINITEDQTYRHKHFYNNIPTLKISLFKQHVK